MDKIALGGKNRIGSGAKIEVEKNHFERTTFNVSRSLKFTSAVGTITPVLTEIALPGTYHDIKINFDIISGPTVGANFGKFKTEINVFNVPFRLYQAQLHNNTNGIGLKMDTIKLPQVRLTAPNPKLKDDYDLDNFQINPSHLFSYLGMRGIGINEEQELANAVTRDFQGLTYIGYLDICKTFYCNKQEGIGAMILTKETGTFSDIYWQLNNVLDTNGVNTTINVPNIGSGTPSVPFTLKYQTEGVFGITDANGKIDPSTIIVKLRDPAIPIFTLTVALTEIFERFVWQEAGTDAVLTGYNVFERFTKDELYIQEWYIDNAREEVTQPELETFPLSDIDDLRIDILSRIKQTSPYIIGQNGQTTGLSTDNIVFKPMWYKQINFQGEVGQEWGRLQQSQNGLIVKTYMSDKFNNWLDSENLTIADTVSAIKVEELNGEQVIFVNEMNMKKKVWKLFNAINAGGGGLLDYYDAVYDHEAYMGIYSPVYCGGMSKMLQFQQIVSNSATADQPLGTLAGRTFLRDGNTDGHITIKSDEPSFIMAMFSITPYIEYSQGNDWYNNLKNMSELHNPFLDQIAFQDLITDEMAWWDTKVTGTNYITPDTLEFRSAGKQPAWMNYMTAYNQVKGNLAIADNMMYQTTTRRYEPSEWSYNEQGGVTKPYIEDLTTNIDPKKYNYIFADVARDAQNFTVEAYFDIEARRKQSGKVMPN